MARHMDMSERAWHTHEHFMCLTATSSGGSACLPALGPRTFELVLGSPSGGSACSGHQTWTLVPVLYLRARVCGTRPAEDGLLRIEYRQCETREPRLHLLPSSRRGDVRAAEAIGSLRRGGDRDFMGDNGTPRVGRTQEEASLAMTKPKDSPVPAF